MAPPKRKTGGRVTPRGGRPGDTADSSRPTTEERASASGRYTAPIPQSARESPPWVPILMLALLIGGSVLIIARNLVFSGNNWLTLVGLGFIMGGLFTATKWR